MALDASPRLFHDRPYLVIDADRFTDACLAAMTDRALAALPPIGAIDQFIDSTDVLGFRPTLCRRIGRIFDAVAPVTEGMAARIKRSPDPGHR